jgi:hypothetical protein
MSLALVQAYSSEDEEQPEQEVQSSDDAESDVDGAPSVPNLAQQHTAASPVSSATDAPLRPSSSLLPSADTVFSEVSPPNFLYLYVYFVCVVQGDACVRVCLCMLVSVYVHAGECVHICSSMLSKRPIQKPLESRLSSDI